MRFFVRFTFWLPVLLALGCGAGYKTAPVSGQVKLDGHPLVGAEVIFSPKSPEGGRPLPISAGQTDESGNYTLSGEGGFEGAVVGEHTVMISLDERNIPDKRVTHFGPPRNLVPDQYNVESTLTCTVPPEGKSDANFELKSK
jgi:hypothetical protein